MITSPLNPGFYASTNMLLLSMDAKAREELARKWLDVGPNSKKLRYRIMLGKRHL